MQSKVNSANQQGYVSWQELDYILKTPESTTEFKILRAAKLLLAKIGLGISMEAIADTAGIGRSTLFRHFPSRDDLVARALDESLTHFHDQVPKSVSKSADLYDWLYSTVATLHKMQLTAGRGLWQLAAAEDKELPDSIARINVKRRRTRHQTTITLAQEAWRRSGRKGKAPRDLELAFALTFTSFTAHSLNFDYGASENESIRVLTELLMSYLQFRNQNRPKHVDG